MKQMLDFGGQFAAFTFAALYYPRASDFSLKMV